MAITNHPVIIKGDSWVLTYRFQLGV